MEKFSAKSSKKRKQETKQTEEVGERKKKVKFNDVVQVKTFTPRKKTHYANKQEEKPKKKQLSGAGKRKKRKANKLAAMNMPSQEDQDDAIIAEMEQKLTASELRNDGFGSLFDILNGDFGDGEDIMKKVDIMDGEDDEVLPLVTDSEEEDVEDISDLEEVEDKKEDPAVGIEHEDVEEEKPIKQKKITEEKPIKQKKITEEKEIPKPTEKKPCIYGSDVGGKYIPPAKRLQMMGEKEDDIITRRHINGQLNRLSEDNMQSIVTILRDLCQKKSRGTVNDIIISLMLLQFDVADPIPERIISERVMLVAIVTSHTGVGLLASFTEKISQRFVDLFRARSGSSEDEGKNLNNFLNVICALYEIKSITKQLVYDAVDLFIEGDHLDEKEVELLLLVLRKVGFQLRSDGPVQMMKIIQHMRTYANTHPAEEGSRLKFMMDTIAAVQNNNIRKIRDYSVEVVDNRRKKVKTLSSVDLECLSDVKLQDLVNADEKGRWWLVGSAWQGQSQNEEKEDDKEIEIMNMEGISSQLIEAAKKLRMNTDIRRKIFFSAMTATDFQEAFETIQKIELKGKQEREIGNVLLEICQNQKTFNLFYFFLINKFCHFNRDYVVIVQCALWDRFKLLKEMSQRKKNNLSKLVTHLLLSSAITINCFKTIPFTEMDQTLVSFLRQVFVQLAQMSKSHEELTAVFSEAKRSKKSGSSSQYRAVRLGLKLFVSHFMLKDKKFMANNQDLRELFEAVNGALVTSSS